MAKALAAVLLLALAGCAGIPTQPPAASPCAQEEASYACQVERYLNVAAP